MSTLFPITRKSALGFDRDFDTLLNAFFGPATNKQTRMTSVSTTPRANIIKNNEGYTIELAAPGFSRDEFEISADNGVLTVQVGTSDTATYVESLTSQEYSYSSFTRSWSLPKEAAIEGIAARYDAGILYVNIPMTGTANEKLVISVD